MIRLRGGNWYRKHRGQLGLAVLDAARADLVNVRKLFRVVQEEAIPRRGGNGSDARRR